MGLQEQKIIGEDLMPGAEKTCGQARFAEPATPQKRHSLAVNDDCGGMERLKSALHQGERQRVSEQIDLKGFHRCRIEVPADDAAAVAGNKKFPNRPPAHVGGPIRESPQFVPRPGKLLQGNISCGIGKKKSRSGLEFDLGEFLMLMDRERKRNFTMQGDAV